MSVPRRTEREQGGWGGGERGGGGGVRVDSLLSVEPLFCNQRLDHALHVTLPERLLGVESTQMSDACDRISKIGEDP